MGRGLGVGLGVPAAMTLMLSPYNRAANQPGTPPTTQNVPATIQQPQQPKPATPQPTAPKQSLEQSSVDMNALAQQIKLHEGVSRRVYPDSQGHPTIGVGFLLDTRMKPDAKKLIESVGANYQSILSGKQSLTEEQVERLFQHDLKTAIQTAHSFVPDLSSHPPQAQMAIIDMAFNLGPNKLNGFVKLKQALQNRNYNLAAKEMTNSKWFGQTKNRGKDLINQMSQAAQ